MGHCFYHILLQVEHEPDAVQQDCLSSVMILWTMKYSSAAAVEAHVCLESWAASSQTLLIVGQSIKSLLCCWPAKANMSQTVGKIQVYLRAFTLQLIRPQRSNAVFSVQISNCSHQGQSALNETSIFYVTHYQKPHLHGKSKARPMRTGWFWKIEQNILRMTFLDFISEKLDFHLPH